MGRLVQLTLEIFPPEYTGISVNPETITFTEVNQKAQYTNEIIPGARKSGKDFSQGYVEWISDKYSVRSQISVIFLQVLEVGSMENNGRAS